MSYGVNIVIASGSSAQSLVPSGYQFPTLAILNPNDGVAYVSASDSDASSSSGRWDWKVPSQSFALLPGTPKWGNLSIFYLDQSGTGHSGEITFYTLLEPIRFPEFHAIGRAFPAELTTLDITQGPQPASPIAGVERLWIDVLNAWGVLLNTGPVNMDFRDMIRSTGTEQISPTSGSGTELGFQPAVPLGFVQAYNRTTAAFLNLVVSGAPLNLQGPTSAILTIDDTRGMYFTFPSLGFRTRTVTIVNGAVGQGLWTTGPAQGMVFLTDGFGRSAAFSFRNSNTLKIFDPDSVWSTVAGNPGTSNFYWSAGNNRYELQNNSGTTFTYQEFSLSSA